MPVNNNIAELDFGKIKENLIASYKSNPKFVDFDFEGSTLSALLDILAYSTHYQGVYANMAFAERFLDSAQLRNSVVSIVKELGYFPRQSQAATATIELNVNSAISGTPSNVVAVRGTQFSASNTDGTNYDFVVENDSVLNYDGSVYSGSVILKQGRIITERFIYDETNLKEFVVSSSGIDVDTLSVKIKSATGVADALAEKWEISKNILLNGPTSKSFHTQEEDNNHIKIFFGDGIIGATPVNGNEIIVEYIETDGVDANGSSGFEIISSISGVSPANITIGTSSKAQGGGDIESIDNIKRNAPNLYQSQNRAVTAQDYKAILLDKYSWIQAMNVWGGEDNSPPRYGRVFVTIKPNYNDTISSAVKAEVESFLNTKKLVGIQVVVIDPDTIYINTTTHAKFNQQTTHDSTVDVSNAINQAVEFYFINTVSDFELNSKYSRLLSAIDNSHASILSNETSVNISTKFIPDTLASVTYSFDFANEINPGSVVSNEWQTGTFGGTTKYKLQDNGNGFLELYRTNLSGAYELDITSVGVHKIDYTTGTITMAAFRPNIEVGKTLEIFATPTSNDIYSKRNIILLNGTNTTTSEAIV